jgi:hypothetical protein
MKDPISDIRKQPYPLRMESIPIRDRRKPMRAFREFPNLTTSHLPSYSTKLLFSEDSLRF